LVISDLRGVPPGAQHDEVFSSNFATQILKGARPVYWDQNGGVPPFHAYLVAPVFALFGTSIVTLRLVSVVCGLLVVVFTYLTARQLFGAAVALFSAALIAVTQWHLFESRVGLEPVTLMLMSAATALLFSKAYFQNPKSQAPSPKLAVGSWKYALCSAAFAALRAESAGTGCGFGILSGVALGLTFYTYQSSPLVMLALVLFAAYLLLAHRAQFNAQWRSFVVMLIVAPAGAAPLVASPVPVRK